MTVGEWFFILIVGAVFLVLGIAGIIWGRLEEKQLFEALSQQHDLREFTLDHVETPQPGALKTGGIISIALGLVMLIAGVIVWLIS